MQTPREASKVPTLEAVKMSNRSWAGHPCGSDSDVDRVRVADLGGADIHWCQWDVCRWWLCLSRQSAIVDRNEGCVLQMPKGLPAHRHSDGNFRTWLVNLLSTRKWDSHPICQLSIRVSSGGAGDKPK